MAKLKVLRTSRPKAATRKVKGTVEAGRRPDTLPFFEKSTFSRRPPLVHFDHLEAGPEDQTLPPFGETSLVCCLGRKSNTIWVQNL